MPNTRARSLLMLAGALCTAGSALAGPDVIVGDLPDVSNYTPTAAEVGFDAFAIGTTSCNIGTDPLNWYTGGTDNRHPVIGQNLFRLHNGRFEQIGQAWLKHGFTALAGNVCSSCPPGSPSGSRLGPGCSDPYSSGLNGGQSGLGPKWQVNASTGIFPYPFASPSWSGETPRRLRVRTADLSPASYPGAEFYVEGHYICGDDAAFGNDNNNASYRRATFSATGSHYNIALTGATVRQLPAIYAWQAADPTVIINTVDVPGDGRFILACKVTGPTAGLYTYEYALHNLNSHRSAGSFSIPLPAGATATAIGFHDVEYHSGEPNAAANPAADDWTASVSATAVTWSGPSYNGTPPSYTLDPAIPYKVLANPSVQWNPGTGNDHSANVLRWGTLFNFRFQTTVAPATGVAQIGLWRPGTGSTANITIPTPGGATGGFPTTGPCCVGQTCTITNFDGCSGTFGTIGATCSPNPCLTPTGACCAQDGSCTIATQAACTGSYLGNDSVCTPNPCPQPATNDLCANAIALCDGIPMQGTTVGATDDGDAGCAGTSGQGASVWYKYTPSGASGTVSVTIDTCSADYDTAISLWSGACPGQTQVGCDDDGCGSFRSRLTRTLNRGQTYLIRVAGYNGETGNFTITATGGGGVGQGCAPSGACCNAGNCSIVQESQCTGLWTEGGTCSPNNCPPLNDDCMNRIGVTVGQIPFNNTNATTDGPGHALCLNAASNQINRDLWYNFPCTFTGTLTVDTCGSSFDTKLAVYDDTGCTNFEQRLLACNDDANTTGGCGPGSLQSKVTIDVVPGRSYTIRVGSYGASAAGAGVLNITANPILTEGACCASDGVCHITADQSACTLAGGTFQGVGAACEPNPCPQPQGACCDGTTCVVGNQASCAGVYQGVNTTCGPAGNPTTCCPANFNQSGGLSVQDIFDFLGGYFANAPAADFNGVNGHTVQDIFDFLAAYFAGC